MNEEKDRAGFAGKPLPVKVEKRDLPCNLCGSRRLDVLYADELGESPPLVDYNFNVETRKTFQIVKCASCALIFTNPMPQMGALYTNTVDKVYLNSKRQRHVTAQHALERILDLQPGGKLLDVGCAIGLFLNMARRHYRVTGIELSAWAADIASRRHEVHRTPLSELKLKEQFEVVTMWGVIEHFEDPRREIEAAFEALTPGGLLVVYTGDADAWLARLLGKGWWWYQGMHLFYFSRATLSRMLEGAGFTVFRYRTHRIYFQLFSLAKSLSRYWIGRLFEPLLTMRQVRSIMIPLAISGEMVLYARKPAKG